MTTELPASLLTQLKNSKDPVQTGKILESISLHSLKQPAAIKTYHDLLLFHCAFPGNGHVYKMAINELERISHEVKRIMDHHNKRNHLALMGSGLPHTQLLCTYSFSITKWLLKTFPSSVELDSSKANAHGVRRILYLFLPRTEYQRATQGDLNLKSRIKLLSGYQDGASQLNWLIKLFDESPLPLDVKEEFYEQLKIFVRWTLNEAFFSRSFLHAETNSIHYIHQFHREVNVGQILKQVIEPQLNISVKTRKRVVEVMKATLAFQYKEIDPFTYANERELELFDLGKGLQVGLVGMVSEKKLSIENYTGFMAFRNGVPQAYGGGWIFGQRCKIGINIFESFRKGESAWTFAQVLRLFYHRHGARQFIVKPFQFGKGNPEGLKSGAFWFYYKLGFRPVEKEIRELADKEWEKRKPGGKGTRSLSTLKRLASCNVELKLQRKIWPDYDASVLSEQFSDRQIKESLHIGFHFDNATGFSEGLSAIQQNDAWGYVDKSGKIIIEPHFNFAGSFTDGSAKVMNKGKWMMIDKTGKKIQDIE